MASKFGAPQGLAELQDASVWKVPNLYVNEPNLARFNWARFGIWGKDECGVLAGGAGNHMLFVLQSRC